jgi:hypothetical protein
VRLILFDERRNGPAAKRSLKEPSKRAGLRVFGSAAGKSSVTGLPRLLSSGALGHAVR